MKAGDIVVSRMTEHQRWDTAVYLGSYKLQGFVWHEVEIIGNLHRELHECCLPLSEKLIGTTNNY